MCLNYSPRFPVDENKTLPPLQAEGFPCYHCLPLHWRISKWEPWLFLSHTDAQTRPPRWWGRQQTEYMGGRWVSRVSRPAGHPRPRAFLRKVDGHCRAVGERRFLIVRRMRVPAGETHDARGSRLGVSNHRQVRIQVTGFRASSAKASGSQPRLWPPPPPAATWSFSSVPHWSLSLLRPLARSSSPLRPRPLTSPPRQPEAPPLGPSPLPPFHLIVGLSAPHSRKRPAGGGVRAWIFPPGVPQEAVAELGRVGRGARARTQFVRLPRYFRSGSVGRPRLPHQS